jgi:hypothetical protein
MVISWVVYHFNFSRSVLPSGLHCPNLWPSGLLACVCIRISLCLATVIAWVLLFISPSFVVIHYCWATLRFIALSTFIGAYGVFAAISWFWLAVSFVNTIISVLLPSRAVILCLRRDFLLESLSWKRLSGKRWRLNTYLPDMLCKLGRLKRLEGLKGLERRWWWLEVVDNSVQKLQRRSWYRRAARIAKCDETVLCSIAKWWQAVVWLVSCHLSVMCSMAFKKGENQWALFWRRHLIHIFDFGIRIGEFASSSLGGIDGFDFQMSRRIWTPVNFCCFGRIAIFPIMGS